MSNEKSFILIFLIFFGFWFFWGIGKGEEKRIENITISGVPAGIESGSEIETDVDCDENFCKISLSCLEPGPKCQKIYFCLDQEDACYPRILYTGTFSVMKSEQKVYLRYYSMAETVEEEKPQPRPEEKPAEPEIVRKPLLQRIFEAIKNFFNRIFKFK